MRRSLGLSLALSLLLSLAGSRALPSRAEAQLDPEQADRALATLTPAELTALSPLLRTGTVSLVEFAIDGALPAIIIATEVDAPAAQVAQVIGDPRHYPDFMPALDSVQVETDAGSQLAYSWAWQTAIFTLRGSNVMQQFAPPPGREAQGYRFVVRSTGGDLGAGRTVWRVLPLPGNRSLLMTSARLDFRDANYIARQLSRASSSMNRTVTIAISFAMVLRTRIEAERRAGHVRAPLPTAGSDPERPAIDPVTLEGLLGRGDLMWVETSGADLGRIAVIGAMQTNEPTTRAAMLDPEGFTQGLVQGSHTRVIERDERGTHFEWGIDLPLVGSSGQMRLGEHEGRVHLDGVQGALGQARWRFETQQRPYGTLVFTWGRFDPADGLWLLRVVTEADAAFRPGLGSATQLMMVRGLRTRLSRGI